MKNDTESNNKLNNYLKILKYANIDSLIVIEFIGLDQETNKIIYHSEFKGKIHYINNDFLYEKVFIGLGTNFLSDLKPACYNNGVLEFSKLDIHDKLRDVGFLNPMYLDIFIKQIDNQIFEDK